MVYGDSKDLTRRTGSGKILLHKAFNIAKNSKYDDYQRNLASMVYKFFHKKAATPANKFAGGGIKNENISNKELAEELHKSVFRKFKKEKYTHLLYTIFGLLILQIYN